MWHLKDRSCDSSAVRQKIPQYMREREQRFLGEGHTHEHQRELAMERGSFSLSYTGRKPMSQIDRLGRFVQQHAAPAEPGYTIGRNPYRWELHHGTQSAADEAEGQAPGRARWHTNGWPAGWQTASSNTQELRRRLQRAHRAQAAKQPTEPQGIQSIEQIVESESAETPGLAYAARCGCMSSRPQARLRQLLKNPRLTVEDRRMAWEAIYAEAMHEDHELMPRLLIAAEMDANGDNDPMPQMRVDPNYTKAVNAYLRRAAKESSGSDFQEYSCDSDSEEL